MLLPPFATCCWWFCRCVDYAPAFAIAGAYGGTAPLPPRAACAACCLPTCGSTMPPPRRYLMFCTTDLPACRAVVFVPLPAAVVLCRCRFDLPRPRAACRTYRVAPLRCRLAYRTDDRAAARSARSLPRCVTVLHLVRCHAMPPPPATHRTARSRCGCGAAVHVRYRFVLPWVVPLPFDYMPTARLPACRARCRYYLLRYLRSHLPLPFAAIVGGMPLLRVTR